MTATLSFVFCPVHGTRVPTDEDGHLAALCSDCAGEAARALTLLEADPVQIAEVGRARLWADQTLLRYPRPLAASNNNTGPSRSVLGESAARARGGAV
jgi:hypothetical protein